ncbi:alkaline phosphatase D family protein [Saccharopolyspora erythraea]|uniref:alkaline phosphatase D family protein n=1 Tax=Saccharopolyspora erythraea TaxID=1836 RepID=UPI001BAA06F1|nr:alkaline phosphatase D family protein [Saccharopolyspora erythraea]QUG99545.1 alkaline phosphatase D family protein [Saccharopolyspora erythraea]
MSDPTTVSRRSVLLGGTAAGAVALSAATALPAAAQQGAGFARRGEVFTLGVASGDPAPDGVVLWTRLAADPLAEDGMGGMPDKTFPVQWEVAEDERFHRVVQRGEAQAAPSLGHSVHVELTGLRPDREYFYRFRAEGGVSPVGRTRTAPLPGAMTELTMAFASCAQFEHGFFTAYRHLAEEHPDLVLHLGDYQYEYKAGDYVIPGGNIRDHAGPETTTLANYRQRHAQYKSDPDLQVAHAAAPWVVVWDDHELDNNWADEIHEKPEKPQPDFLERRKAAFQAYYENMPLRRAQVPKGIDLRLHRRIEWGRLATFHMLDTRQYRDDQVGGDKVPTTDPARLDPARSLTGAEQERWLLKNLRSSNARWDVLGQQVMFAEIDLAEGDAEGYNPDAWDGYVGSRQRVIQGFQQGKVRNPVVLTGDVHKNWANDVQSDGRTVATELTTTSITSGGDGSESLTDKEKGYLRDNPHVRFYSNQRGYIRTRFTEGELRADYRVVPYVSKQGAPVRTAASFVVEDGRPGLNPA